MDKPEVSPGFMAPDRLESPKAITHQGSQSVSRNKGFKNDAKPVNSTSETLQLSEVGDLNDDGFVGSGARPKTMIASKMNPHYRRSDLSKIHKHSNEALLSPSDTRQYTGVTEGHGDRDGQEEGGLLSPQSMEQLPDSLHKNRTTVQLNDSGIGTGTSSCETPDSLTVERNIDEGSEDNLDSTAESPVDNSDDNGYELDEQILKNFISGNSIQGMKRELTKFIKQYPEDDIGLNSKQSQEISLGQSQTAKCGNSIQGMKRELTKFIEQFPEADVHSNYNPQLSDSATQVQYSELTENIQLDSESKLEIEQKRNRTLISMLMEKGRECSALKTKLTELGQMSTGLAPTTGDSDTACYSSNTPNGQSSSQEKHNGTDSNTARRLVSPVACTEDITTVTAGLTPGIENTDQEQFYPSPADSRKKITDLEELVRNLQESHIAMHVQMRNLERRCAQCPSHRVGHSDAARAMPSNGCWYLDGQIEGLTDSVQWLIDSGANGNTMDKDVFDRIDPRHKAEIQNEEESSIVTANGEQLEIFGTSRITVLIRGLVLGMDVTVARLGADKTILGCEFLNETICHFKDGHLTYDGQNYTLRQKQREE